MSTKSNLQVPSTSSTSVTLETIKRTRENSTDASDTAIGKDGPSEKRVKIGESRRQAVHLIKSAQVSNISKTHSTPNKISLQVRNDK